MRGRPKKPLDKDLILKLHAEGLTSREIAIRVDASKNTVCRCLKILSQKSILSQNKSTSLSQNSSDVSQNSVPKSPNPSDVKPNIVPKPPQTCVMPTNTTPTSSAPLALATLHRDGYSIVYAGKQPLNDTVSEYGQGKCNKTAKFVGEDYVIQTHKDRLVIYPRGIKGDTPEEMQGRSLGRARLRLGEFASRFGLKLDWKFFKHVTEAEYNLVEGPVNDVMLEVLSTDKQMAKDMKVLPGDSTHKGQTEFHDKDKLVRLKRVLDGDYEQRQVADAKYAKETIKNILDTLIVLSKDRELSQKADIQFKSDLGEFIKSANERFALLESRYDKLAEEHIRAKVMLRET